MTRYRTQSRTKALREFLAHPALHAVVGVIAALAVFYWLENSTWLMRVAP